MKIFQIGTFDENGFPTGWGFDGEGKSMGIEISENGNIDIGDVPYNDLIDIAKSGIIPEKYRSKYYQPKTP